MRLSSLFQRQRPAEADRPVQRQHSAGADRNAQWRKTDFRVYSLGQHIQTVHIRGTIPKNFPSFAVEFVLACDKFRRLDEHLAEHAEKHDWDSLQIESLRKHLPDLIEAGLLISNAEVTRRCAVLREPPNQPPPIEFIGFPTGGNRTELLERAIRSFAENAQTYSRKVSFLVSDNSTTSEQRQRFRSLAASLGKHCGVPILFAGEEEKRRFAGRLLRKREISPEAVEFALFDPLNAGFSCGANRNALLLHTAGRMLCSVDDDVICRLAASPEAIGTGLFCFSESDPYSRWLYPERESAMRDARWVERDFLGIHEEMLGRDAGAFFAAGSPQAIDYTQTGDEFLRRALSRPGRIYATYTGHIGDPGIPTSTYYLHYDRENRRRLVESEEHYRSVFGSRSILSVVRSHALGDATVSPGMAMAFDQRELIPPFFPVLHAEDYSHGAALWQCCPDAFIGHLPVALYHEPGTGKAIVAPCDLTEDRRVVVFEFAHLLRRLILTVDPPEQLDTAGRMQTLGRRLAEYTAMPAADFAELLKDQALAHASDQCEHLAKELNDDHESPDYWREDVEALIGHIQHSAAFEDAAIPLDMKSSRQVAETHRLIQELIRRYSVLLGEWPAMIEAASELRDNGEPLFASPAP